jgi:hypothetical protein
MHPDLYRNLPIFALAFDRISLYAVSGVLLEAYCPLTVSQFCDLVNDPSSSPFLLTAPVDFYEPHKRKERLNQNVMQWTGYDDWIVDRRGTDSIVSVRNSLEIRTRAEDISRRYRDYARKQLRSDEILNNAYTAARTQYETEKRLYPDPKLAALSFDGSLPATFYHEAKHTNLYKEMLANGDVLPLLTFEHFTKPQIIKSLRREIRNRGGGTAPIEMYVPDSWHTCLWRVCRSAAPPN